MLRHRLTPDPQVLCPRTGDRCVHPTMPESCRHFLQSRRDADQVDEGLEHVVAHSVLSSRGGVRLHSVSRGRVLGALEERFTFDGVPKLHMLGDASYQYDRRASDR